MSLAMLFSPRPSLMATVTSVGVPSFGVTRKTIEPSERAVSLTSTRHLFESFRSSANAGAAMNVATAAIAGSRVRIESLAMGAPCWLERRSLGHARVECDARDFVAAAEVLHVAGHPRLGLRGVALAQRLDDAALGDHDAGPSLGHSIDH